MKEELFNKACVRIRLKINDEEKVNLSSGMIIKDNKSFIVLTGYHCICGDDDEFIEIQPENIIVEHQNKYDSPFNLIKVKQIIAKDKAQDWALLEIENPQITIDFSKIIVAKNFIEGEQIRFSGYQKQNETSFRPFKGEVLTMSQGQFKINLKEDTFSQAGEDGAYIAKGLSGSIVCIKKADSIYVIGIVKSVIGEIALHNDINCCSISCLESNLGVPIIDMGDMAITGKWEESTRDLASKEELEKWQNLNNRFYNNLTRKHNIIYTSEKKASEIISKRILKYLLQENRNDQIRKQSNQINSFESLSDTFEESVKEYYTRNVANSHEAKDLLLKLEKEFSDYLTGIQVVNPKDRLNLAKHKVTWWLMNCSLDFKE